MQLATLFPCIPCDGSNNRNQHQHRPRISKAMIGLPSGFQHVGHMGAGDVAPGATITDDSSAMQEISKALHNIPMSGIQPPRRAPAPPTLASPVPVGNGRDNRFWGVEYGKRENGGEEQGLTRVRRFHQDNAHSFCTPTQIASENADTLRFVHAVFTVFQLPSYEFLSTRPETFIGGLGEWEQAEDALKEALDTIPLDGNGRRRKAMDQRSTSYSKTGRLIPATTAADVIAYAEAVQRRLSGISTTTEPVPPTPTLELATRTFSVDIDASEGKPLSKAQKRRANFTLVVGQKEMKNGTVTMGEKSVEEVYRMLLELERTYQ
ncbi:hypothetical protein SAICODRAFT_22235 [Saitoella complicata NRRL Y-17804]|uniref:uncharacterized protein n=1 Tax=Saitoella complicata (strain BCRC 22490 / CBS 7301 / JCM 7358 / NBRC 10748 / NRRL Y-17804) TaxID=698492 RepID=UPI000867DF66|nr:uncharacterized protein SAICODRAFT_22235 [Saitoella complicata NRRL Y-17804]ODQ49677.1 hypothetical protein SAICODRAFT_22235 [Saitoella complicata NRRL Y-17804]